MPPHDNSYKLLFSHPEMVRDLLAGFVNEPWVAELDFASLEKVSGSYVADDLRDYTPRLKYLLLDEGAIDETGPLALRNLAAALFSLEKSRTAATMNEMVGALVDWLRAPEQDSLRRAFAVWIHRVLLPGQRPGTTMPKLGDLLEIKTMLAETVVEWTQQWKME